MVIMVTYHADMRIKERVGIKSSKRREALAEAAYMEGMRIDCCDSLSAKEIMAHSKYENREPVVYKDQLFIFDGNVLITVLPVNKDYRRIMEARRAKVKRTGHEETAA